MRKTMIITSWTMQVRFSRVFLARKQEKGLDHLLRLASVAISQWKSRQSLLHLEGFEKIII